MSGKSEGVSPYLGGALNAAAKSTSATSDFLINACRDQEQEQVTAASDKPS